jgi:hypothetical protein
MARPKTKTDPIVVRLSLAAGGELERRATAKGLPVRQYLESSLEVSLASAPSTAAPENGRRLSVVPPAVESPSRPADGRAHEWVDHATFGKICSRCHTPRSQAARDCPGG